MSKTCTTDVLVEMPHKWYEATYVKGNFVRVLFLDYRKAFDLINHDILIDKLVKMELPAHLVGWMAAFLLDREQRVKIKDAGSRPGYHNGGVLQGTLSGPKNCLVYINDLRTPCHIYKYVDNSTIFLICNQNRVFVRIQLTLLRRGLAIMICALIRVRQNKWSYVSVKIERMLNLCRILI